MHVFNCLVHSEGPGSPRGLAAASGTKGQQICITTKTISDHHLETLHNSRKRLAEHSWKTSLQYRYITPHSQSKGAKAKLKQKPSLSSPCSTLTKSNTGVAVLEEQEAKFNFLFDRPLALLCFCSQGHHQSSAINPSPNDILPLNQAFSASLLLQLSILAHFCQNNKSSQICNLNDSQEIIKQGNPISCPPATACYVFALHPLAGLLKSAGQRKLIL